MLKWRNTLLYIRDLAGCETAHLCLVKWAFLLREESGRIRMPSKF
jgi:hypothetical protein